MLHSNYNYLPLALITFAYILLHLAVKGSQSGALDRDLVIDPLKSYSKIIVNRLKKTDKSMGYLGSLESS